MTNINDSHVNEFVERVSAKPNTICDHCGEEVYEWKTGGGETFWTEGMTIWKFCPHCGESPKYKFNIVDGIALVVIIIFFVWLFWRF